MAENQNSQNTDLLFFTELSKQRQAIDTLVKESRADGDYYFALIISGLIACLGLLNDNPVVVIGAMLIAPALFPILSLGMALVTDSKQALYRSLRAIVGSFVSVVLASAVLAFLFKYLLDGSFNQTIELTSSPNGTSWLVAALSGLIASYAWVKQSQSAMLPGVAVAVSLVPPLANIGIGLVTLSPDVFSGSLLTFIINIIMITVFSVVVFSVFGFAEMRSWQQLRLKQEDREIQKQKLKVENTIQEISKSPTSKENFNETK